jgi:hypothetical protein
LGAIGRTVAAQIRRNGEVPRLRERWKDVAPRRPSRREAVEEGDEMPVVRPAGYAMQPNVTVADNALGETDGGGHGAEPYRRILLRREGAERARSEARGPPGAQLLPRPRAGAWTPRLEIQPIIASVVGGRFEQSV